MSLIYHGVPAEMSGTLLLPLSEIKFRYPDLAAKYLEKYTGREEVLLRRIELLDCLWNEAVQFLPVHPKRIFELQYELGLIKEIPNYKYYELDSSELDPKNTVVYFKSAVGEENVNVKWLSEVDLEEIQSIPQATKSYFESLVGTNLLPFNYQFIPHIIFKGSVDISETKIIKL